MSKSDIQIKVRVDTSELDAAIAKVREGGFRMKHVMNLDDGTQVGIDPTTSTVEVSKDAGTTWKSVYEPKATRTDEKKGA